MRKRILKRKKKVNVYKKRKGAGRALTLAAALCLFLTAAVPVCGKETETPSESQQAPRTIVTDINHKHVGNASVSGGCYNIAVKHEHIGNEMTGGACFQIPVPHTHKGNENEKGGCYVTAVKHDHVGDEINGGPCYAPAEIHNCTTDCFVEESCMVCYTPEEIIGTEQRKCFEHGETTYAITRGREVHDSCPQGITSSERSYCQICGPMPPTIHNYQKKICGMEDGQVLRYVIVCSKTVDRYEIGCGKTDKDADSYRKTCEKEVDGYKIGCGFEENEVCGRLIVTNETPGKEEQVTLSVRVEDLTGGKLKLSDHPFTWKDESGNILGEGEKIRVNENGTYSVAVNLENNDVDKNGLSSKILVDNIYKAQITVSPKPTATPSGKPNPTGTPLPTDKPEPTIVPTSSKSPSPTASAVPSGTPKPDSKDDRPDDSGDSGSNGNEEDGNDAGQTEGDERRKKEEKTDIVNSEGEDGNKTIGSSGRKFTGHVPETTPSPSPAAVKPIHKETKEVTVPEKKAAGESQYKTGQQTKGNSFFASPAVRVISITAGLALLLLGIALLLLYLRNSVKVCNDDGKGRLIYLGRCMVEEEENAYAVTITDAMVEKAYTNRYCIKPGLFLIGKKEGEELIVHKEAKRIAVCLDREMIVML